MTDKNKTQLSFKKEICGAKKRESAKADSKCKYCGAEYEERCIHNPSHNYIIKKDGFK